MCEPTHQQGSCASGAAAAMDLTVMIVACGPVVNEGGTQASLVYAIMVVQPVQSWTVLRSHDDFEVVAQSLTPFLDANFPKCPSVVDATSGSSLTAIVQARDDMQAWLVNVLMHAGARSSSAVTNFLTLGANTIPSRYEAVQWTQFNAVTTSSPDSISSTACAISSDAHASTAAAASALSTSGTQYPTPTQHPHHGHHQQHQQQQQQHNSHVYDMEMDDMFLADDDGPAGPHDDDNDVLIDEDYIPSASERYKRTDEACTDEDMDILQLAGAEVEMIEDIGSLAQSLGASHLGRSLQLQAEMKRPSAIINHNSDHHAHHQSNRPGGLNVGSGGSGQAERRVSGTGGGIGSAMEQAQSNAPSFNYKPPVSAPRLDSFKMIKVIGKGSFGKVFLVKENMTGEIYALKVLRKDNIIKRNQVEHTRTERSVLGYVKHPFIVGMNMAFQSKDKLYFVLDYCAGGELFFHLGKLGKFPENRARFYTAEIVLAISYVHSLDIIYRDLKPENVLLDAQGHIRLTDFGLSKEGISSSSSGANSFCGTPEYLAPEILNRQGHGRAVDWWSLGALLYEMLTGLPPFYCQDRERLFEKIRRSELHYPASVSAPAKSVLVGLLTKDPTRRLGSGNEDSDEIKRHDFFKEIDFCKLFAGEITPPWRPDISSSLDTSQFDKEFTNMPVFSPQSMQRIHGFGATPSENLFEGFTFTDRNILHGPRATQAGS